MTYYGVLLYYGLFLYRKMLRVRWKEGEYCQMIPYSCIFLFKVEREMPRVLDVLL